MCIYTEYTYNYTSSNKFIEIMSMYFLINAKNINKIKITS